MAATIGFLPISNSRFARLCTEVVILNKIDIISGAQTFTTRRVSFPENMMFTPWVVVLGSSSTYATK